MTELTLLALLTSNTFSLVAICSSMFWWKKKIFLLECKNNWGRKILNYMYTVNQGQLILRNFASWAFMMSLLFSKGYHLFSKNNYFGPLSIGCFTGVPNTVLRVNNIFILGFLPEKQVHSFDILIFFLIEHWCWCFRSRHHHLCDYSYQQLQLSIALASLAESSSS